MSRIVFVKAGRKRREFEEMPDADARLAVAEGWGQIANDPVTNARSYELSDEPEHVERANAYFNKRLSGYHNRQLEAAPSPSPQTHPPVGAAEPDGGTEQLEKPVPPKGKTIKTK